MLPSDYADQYDEQNSDSDDETSLNSSQIGSFSSEELSNDNLVIDTDLQHYAVQTVHTVLLPTQTDSDSFSVRVALSDEFRDALVLTLELHTAHEEQFGK